MAETWLACSAVHHLVGHLGSFVHGNSSACFHGRCFSSSDCSYATCSVFHYCCGSCLFFVPALTELVRPYNYLSGIQPGELICNIQRLWLVGAHHCQHAQQSQDRTS